MGVGMDLSKLKGKDLLAMLDRLSPDQLSAVRGAAAAAGLPVPSSGGSLFAELPSGAIRVTVEVPSDLSPALKEWADAAGETFEVFLQHYIVEALNAYSMHDWQGTQS
jgi:predicted DNA binding CopG/RHH family protein